MYGYYRGRCIGRVLHFLYAYHIQDADMVTFNGPTATNPDNWQITLRGKLFATYSWDEDSDVPTFKFFGDHAKFFEERQVQYKDWVLEKDKLREEFRKGFLDTISKGDS